MKISEWIAGTGSVSSDYFSQRAAFAFDIYNSFYLVFDAYYSTEGKKELFQGYCRKTLSLEEYDSIMVTGGILLAIGEIDSALIKSLDELLGLENSPVTKDIDPNLLIYSSALVCFYNRLSIENKVHNIDLNKLHAIDLMMAKIAREIGRQEAYMVLEGYRTDQVKERTGKSAIAKNKYKGIRKQITLELYHTIESRSKHRPYTIARMIQERWKKSVPNESPPSSETIVRYIKDDLSKK